jgi:MFS family permease
MSADAEIRTDLGGGSDDEPHAAPGAGSADGREGMFSAAYLASSLGIVAAMLLTAFEAVAVATAMPVAVRSLHGLPMYSLAFSAYLTTSLLGTVLAGGLADRYGPAVPYLAGAACFGSGLLLGGTATSMGQFVAGRAVQGVGGGMIIVALYVLVARGYPERIRPRAFSLMATCWVLPGLGGPLISGTLAQDLSWRWVFLGVAAVIPIPVVALVRPLRRLSLSRDADTEPARTARRSVPLGVALCVGGGLLQYASQSLNWLGLGVAVLGFAALAVSVPRLLPAGTLRARRGLPTIVLMRGLMAGCYVGTESFVPLLLVNERRLSSTEAGLVLTVATISWALGTYTANRTRALPGGRPGAIRFGALATACGIAMAMLALPHALPPIVAGLAMLVSAFGMGLSIPSVSVLLIELSPVEDQGTNSAALQMCDNLASIISLGVAGAIFHALHTRAGHDGHVYVIIFGVMVAIALLAFAVAPRVVPRVPPRRRDDVGSATRAATARP